MKTQQNSFSEIGSVIAGVALAALFLFMAPYVFAQQPLHNIAPYNATSEGCVAVSSFAWTQGPATNLTGRLGFYWSNPSTNTLTGTTDNTVAVTSGPYLCSPNSMVFIPLYDGKSFYQRANVSGGTVLGCTAQGRN